MTQFSNYLFYFVVLDFGLGCKSLDPLFGLPQMLYAN